MILQLLMMAASAVHQHLSKSTYAFIDFRVILKCDRFKLDYASNPPEPSIPTFQEWCPLEEADNLFPLYQSQIKILGCFTEAQFVVGHTDYFQRQSHRSRRR